MDPTTKSCEFLDRRWTSTHAARTAAARARVRVRRERLRVPLNRQIAAEGGRSRPRRTTRPTRPWRCPAPPGAASSDPGPSTASTWRASNTQQPNATSLRNFFARGWRGNQSGAASRGILGRHVQLRFTSDHGCRVRALRSTSRSQCPCSGHRRVRRALLVSGTVDE